MRYGVKSITMDDVAKELSISKKTVYQYITDKNDLVNKTMRLHLEELEHQCNETFKTESNALLQILKIASNMVQRHKEMNPGLLFDLKKYHPETYNMFLEHRENTIFSQMSNNLELGIKQGFYKNNLNKNITIGFYLSLIETCIVSNIQMLNTIEFTEKYDYLIKYHLNATCTEKGLQFISNYQKDNVLTHPHL